MPVIPVWRGWRKEDSRDLVMRQSSQIRKDPSSVRSLASEKKQDEEQLMKALDASL